jgi:hypothetical protein
LYLQFEVGNLLGGLGTFNVEEGNYLRRPSLNYITNDVA